MTSGVWDVTTALPGSSLMQHHRFRPLHRGAGPPGGGRGRSRRRDLRRWRGRADLPGGVGRHVSADRQYRRFHPRALPRRRQRISTSATSPTMRSQRSRRRGGDRLLRRRAGPADATPNYPAFDPPAISTSATPGRWNGNDGCIFRSGRAVRPRSGPTRSATSRTAARPPERFVSLRRGLPHPGESAGRNRGQMGPPGRPRSVVELPRNVPDGVAFDEAGNLYIACYTPDVIYRADTDGQARCAGERLAKSPSPRRPISRSAARSGGRWWSAAWRAGTSKGTCRSRGTVELPRL